MVCATGSLTEAARRLHISQPAVSHRLSTLQARVGAPLFLRRDGCMRPTDVGQRLAASAESVSGILDRTRDDIDKLVSGRQRTFRFTTQCQTSVRWMSFLIRDMVSAHPNLTIDFVPEAVEDPCGAVRRGDVDVALAYAADDAMPRTTDDLFEDELYALMSTSHPLADRQYLNPGNFRNETLILYAGKRSAFVDLILEPAGVRPTHILQLKLTEAMIELARANQGIAVVAAWALNDMTSRRGLTAIRIGRSGYRRKWRALVNEECPDELLKSFIEKVSGLVAATQEAGWRTRLEKAKS